MIVNKSHIIRTANKVWEGMYYDELKENDNYQLSYAKVSDRDYYNCAHDIQNFNSNSLKEIEKFFFERRVTPAIYVDIDASPLLYSELQKRGYSRQISDEEQWYYFDLMQHSNVSISDVLKLPLEEICIREINAGERGDIYAFLDINGSQNNLSKQLRGKLLKHLRNQENSCVKNHALILYAYEKPATTGTYGILGDWAFLAEGATSPSFQKKGLYTTLILKTLEICKKRGCQYAFINCDKGAFSNQVALKIGFRPLCQRSLLKGLKG